MIEMSSGSGSGSDSGTRKIIATKLTQGSREWNGEIRRKKSGGLHHQRLESGRHWEIENALGTIIQEKPLENDLEKIVWNEIQRKLSSYRQQDIRQKRLPSDSDPSSNTSFASAETMITPVETATKLLEQKLICFYCKDPMKLGTTIVRDPEQWTLERKDNRFPHTNENCVIACLRCNLRRNTKVHTFFKKSFGVVVAKTESDSFS
jgi:5-methylcytosine-specific restriction endonuclease McrA